MNENGAFQGLTFINVSHPDEVRQRATQTAIRSGSMAAVGRARRKRPLKRAPVTVDLNVPSREIESRRAIDTALRRPGVTPSLPHLGIFAVEPDRRARQLLSFIQIEADYVYRPFWTGWITMAMLDPSTYYLSLANAALFMNQSAYHQASLEYTDCLESTKYYSRCLTLVLSHLGNTAENISPGIITTILGFVCHNLTVGKWDQSDMHLQGLERIIRNRKGFHGLDDHMRLFTAWFDVINSAIHDSPPRFSIPFSIGHAMLYSGELSASCTHLISRLEDRDIQLPGLGACLAKVAKVAAYISKNSGTFLFWRDGLKAITLIGPPAHCVLSLPRPSVPELFPNDEEFPLYLLQEIVRLALLMILASLKEAFSLLSAEQESLYEKFSNLIPHTTSLWQFPELSLWAHLVCASTQKNQMSLAQVSEIRRAMGDLDILTGDGAIRIARSIIWIDCLMDPEVDRIKQEIN